MIALIIAIVCAFVAIYCAFVYDMRYHFKGGFFICFVSFYSIMYVVGVSTINHLRSKKASNSIK